MPRFENIIEIAPDLNGEGLRIGLVMARFNQDVCEGLLSSCIAELKRLGVADQDMLITTVPGALEIPLVLQALADSEDYDALVALGAVIRGDTYHFEIVSNEMAAGINRVGLDTGLPIANGVLTTDDDAQALARMHEQGTDCARAAVERVHLVRAVEA